VKKYKDRIKIKIVNIIATIIDENPGCRRIFVIGNLYFAYYGCKPDVSLDSRWMHLWKGYFGDTFSHLWKEYYNTGKWYLESQGSELVLDESVELNFEEGDLIECREWASGKWKICLVMTTNKWGGVWAVCDGKPKYYNFRSRFRLIKDL